MYPIERAARDTSLTTQTLKVYDALLEFGYEAGHLRVTVAQIARALEVNERAVSRALLCLETHGYIIRERIGAGTTSGQIIHLVHDGAGK